MTGRSKIEALECEGWTRQFVAEEPRLSEAVAMYKELGFEVHLEPFPKVEEPPGAEGGSSECRRCFQGFEERYKIIFTRPKDEE